MKLGERLEALKRLADAVFDASLRCGDVKMRLNPEGLAWRALAAAVLREDLPAIERFYAETDRLWRSLVASKAAKQLEAFQAEQVEAAALSPIREEDLPAKTQVPSEVLESIELQLSMLRSQLDEVILVLRQPRLTSTQARRFTTGLEDMQATLEPLIWQFVKWAARV